MRALILAVALTSAFIRDGLASAESVAMTLEGDSLEGDIGSIDGAGRVTIGSRQVQLDSLRYIAPAVSKSAAPDAGESALRILLVCGSDLRASNLSFLEEEFVFASASVGSQLKIPVDSVRAVRLALPIEGSRFEKTLALEAEKRDEDTVYVTGVAGELLELNCLIESITPEAVSFDRNGKKQTIARDKIHGVILASPDLDEPMPCRAVMADRSSFAGKIISLGSGELKLQMIDGIKVQLPWENVRRLRIYSPRLVSVAELEPSDVKTQPILAPEWSFRKNKSVAGNELTIGDQIFDQGLGLAAGMKLEYKLDGDYDLFTAMIGIDSETQQRGDCEFVVFGDGSELFRKRMRGTDPPELIRVNVRDVRLITISVEAGENLDISDHANWAEASLLQGG